jgi:hypothetical protein
VIPAERLDEIATAVRAIAVKELGWIERIEGGTRIADILGFRESFTS